VLAENPAHGSSVSAIFNINMETSFGGTAEGLGHGSGSYGKAAKSF
jgi:hypothetical protein